MPATTRHKVLFVLNRIDIGGTCVNTIPLANYLQQYYSVAIAYGATNTQQQALNYFQQQYPSLTFLPIQALQKKFNVLFLFKAFQSFKKIVNNYNPTIIHTHGSLAGFIARFFTQPSIIYIHTFHGHLFHSYFNAFVSNIIKKTEQYLATKSHAIIAVSQQQQADIVHHFKITSTTKTYVIPIGVDVNFLAYQATAVETFKQQFIKNSTATTIALVGRITAIKNPFLFVDICVLLQKNTTQQFNFLLIGDGDMKEATLAYAKQKNITLTATSWVTPIATALYNIDILLLTSLNEGTPLCIVEAGFCGKPTVAANVGGVQDIIQHNKTGLLINNTNANHFVAAIVKLVQDKYLYQTISNNAKQYVQTYHLLTQQAQLTHTLYQQLFL